MQQEIDEFYTPLGCGAEKTSIQDNSITTKVFNIQVPEYEGSPHKLRINL